MFSDGLLINIADNLKRADNVENLEKRNRKIIDAVIEKAEKICPGSLALIGVYGSFSTGDFHKRSDLDLLILINDDSGWQLGCAFIQDDLGVGHDIYCTTWEDMRQAALYNDPNIAKLMDSQIVYCCDEKYRSELLELRKSAAEIMNSPFSREDFLKAEKSFKEAEHFYVSAMVSEGMADIREQAGYALYYLENAVAMLNKKYFRLGMRRIYEELEAMEKRPDGLCGMIERVVGADSGEEIKNALAALIRETALVFRRERKKLSNGAELRAENISGTYEEMFSNWRGKMHLAADVQDRHLAFMSIANLSAMLSETGFGGRDGKYDGFGFYDPEDLGRTALGFDDFLDRYLGEYDKAGIKPLRFPDIDSFAEYYGKMK